MDGPEYPSIFPEYPACYTLHRAPVFFLARRTNKAATAPSCLRDEVRREEGIDSAGKVWPRFFLFFWRLLIAVTQARRGR